MVTDLTCLARPCWSIDANTHSSDRQAADGRQSDLTLSIAAEKSADPAKAPVEVIITLKHLAAALSDTHDLPKKQVKPSWTTW
jgi:hypothetical protein